MVGNSIAADFVTAATLRQEAPTSLSTVVQKRESETLSVAARSWQQAVQTFSSMGEDYGFRKTST